MSPWPELSSHIWRSACRPFSRPATLDALLDPVIVMGHGLLIQYSHCGNFRPKLKENLEDYAGSVEE
jgi:hypothetical protein